MKMKLMKIIQMSRPKNSKNRQTLCCPECAYKSKKEEALVEHVLN